MVATKYNVFVYTARPRTKFGSRRKLRTVHPYEFLGPAYPVRKIMSVRAYQLCV